MMTSAPHRDDRTDRFPPELVRHVTDMAERDAAAVGEWLTGPDQSPRSTASYTREALLAFAAVARLKRWEEAGSTPGVGPRLPTAAEALETVIRSRVAPADQAKASLESLAGEVFAATVNRFAWTGRTDLGTDIVLVAGDEDDVVEAMAQFLWRNRHRGGTSTEERTDG